MIKTIFKKYIIFKIADEDVDIQIITNFIYSANNLVI